MAANESGRDPHCLFCAISADRIVAENDLALAVRDVHPVTPLHTLVIPKRHIEDFFTVKGEEWQALFDLMNRCRDEILVMDSEVDGFNFGANIGAVAGQTIYHAHMHLIPRRAGDVDNPAGGVRGVIPGKQKY
ncbi:MAG: HIT family protein [Alphaproteobacteria bacterium]|nr:HIT family protein [Alphaproteobacteria bacterium]